MAKALNKNRILYSRAAFVIMFGIVLLTRQFWGNENPIHEILDMLGAVLVGICAIGRVYATAFLGGFKNEDLITYGPFSVVRNPLYTCTLIGVIGVALMSNHISIMIALPAMFIFMYQGLIAREEAFLTETFGETYLAYKNSVPRLIPKVSLYNAPETVSMTPKFLKKALGDAIWWFLPLPIFELIEALQETEGFFDILR